MSLQVRYCGWIASKHSGAGLLEVYWALVCWYAWWDGLVQSAAF